MTYLANQNELRHNSTYKFESHTSNYSFSNDYLAVIIL